MMRNASDGERSDWSEEDPEGDAEDFADSGWEGFDDEDLYEGLVKAACEYEDDPDWIPLWEKIPKGNLCMSTVNLNMLGICNNSIQLGRPKMYAKGPDVMIKSLRTQQRYRKSWKGQTSLDTYFLGGKTEPDLSSGSAIEIEEPIESAAPDSPEQVIPRRRRALTVGTVDSGDGLSIAAGDGIGVPDLLEDSAIFPSVASSRCDHSEDRDSEGHVSESDFDEPDPEETAETMEEWEHELDERVQGSHHEIRDWGLLRQQIKADLKKQHRRLSLSQINQLMVLSNFATLRLKILHSLQPANRLHFNGMRKKENGLHARFALLHDITKSSSNFHSSAVVVQRRHVHF